MTSRVVIVEDHLLVRDLFSHIVRAQMNLAVVAECRSLAEGVTSCLRDKPDLAIVDWALPDGSGFDLIRRTGAKLPGARWICFSATERATIIREAIDLGFHGFVLKRSDFATMRLAIGAVLAGQMYLCPGSTQLLLGAMHAGDARTKEQITPRERDVLCGVACGKSIKTIADELSLEVKTVNNHMTRLKDKLGIYEPAGLVRYAIKHGLVGEP